MRSLIILLSLVVFFLTGLIIGIDRGHQGDDYAPVDEAAEQEEQQILAEKNASDRETLDNEMTTPDTQEHFTHKTASFLEASVKGFYELVVGIAYQLVQVFF
ncbi:hypothetical protein [Lentibacillus sp.]|uniref:hypothetical protein n=1 Tax=Lentibacillus sp. TaxID=1925746 RepID=UPI002B4B1427|nr:hypothetical protein [Lentibacillus sp.]HLS07631.1 hypothetical protein [Lentibacillus sp.]